jgi:DNA replication protein DnaC
VDHHWNGCENQTMLRRLILFTGPTGIGKSWMAQGEQLQRR